MSDLYLDEIEKIKYYKQKFIDSFLAQGIPVDKEKIQSYLDNIDAKISIFSQGYINSGETFNVKKFNEQKEDIYKDLSILYQILYKLTNDRVEKAKIKMKYELDALRLKAKRFQYLVDLQSISVYGKTIYSKTNNFDQEYKDGKIIVHLGQIHVPSGSYIAPMFSCDEVDIKDVVFKFDKDTSIPAYNYNKNYLKVVGNYDLSIEYHENPEKLFGKELIAADTVISKNNQYNLFLNKNKIRVKNSENKVFYVQKDPEIYYKANGEEEISFYVYGATSIKFNMLGEITYKNFSEKEVLSPTQRHKIIISGKNFSFDVKTDGQIYAEKVSASVQNSQLNIHRNYEDITDYTIENIIYGDNWVYNNVDVIISNAPTAFYDINYIIIKQAQITELEDRE